MKVTACVNQKGGVCKTATAVTLAAVLAEQAPGRVLLIDMDPQGQSSDNLGLRVQRMPPVCQVLCYGIPLDGQLVRTPFGFDLLAGGRDISIAELALGQDSDRVRNLRDALDGVRDRYDHVLIDCPPSLGAVNQAALHAADFVLVPMLLEPNSIDGMAQLLEAVNKIRQRDNPGLRVSGVVKVRTVQDALSRELDEELRTYCGDLLLKAAVRRCVPIARAPRLNAPVTSSAPKSIGALDYRAVASELTLRGAL